VIALLGGSLRPEMVEALALIAPRYRTACLTNNVRGAGEGPGMQATPERAAEVQRVMSMFDLVVESSRIGLRKPDRRVYELACRELEIEPREAVFLDDLGVNLKPARAMGMRTIKVVSAAQALAELELVLGMALRPA
jgi:putative hydrolase of the HAD superfamily